MQSPPRTQARDREQWNWHRYPECLFLSSLSLWLYRVYYWPLPHRQMATGQDQRVCDFLHIHARAPNDNDIARYLARTLANDIARYLARTPARYDTIFGTNATIFHGARRGRYLTIYWSGGGARAQTIFDDIAGWTRGPKAAGRTIARDRCAGQGVVS